MEQNQRHGSRALFRYSVLVLLALTLGACGGGGGGGTTTLPATPTAPANASLTVAPGQLQFSWDAATLADHYRILVNADGSSGFTVVPAAANISTTSYAIDIPVLKTNWQAARYLVEACDAAESNCLASAELVLSPVDSVAATVYIKASNTAAGDNFGYAVALSEDGNTLAVGAPFEASNAGAVYVYSRSTAGWVQQAYVKASNSEVNDGFGWTVALSADGNRLAVSALGEDSNAKGVNQDQADNSATGAGAVYVFTRSGASWSQQAYVKASNTEAKDGFGWSLALSADGNTLAVGTPGEDSNAEGINQVDTDNTAPGSGAVYVYARSGTSWSQQAYVKASNTDAGDVFGWSVSLSANGNTLAVGARGEASNANGINQDQTDNTALDSGAVYVYTRSGSSWSQQAYVKASNTEAGDRFGWSLALNDDGNSLVVGAPEEDSDARGINQDPADNFGAVYVFTLGTGWSQQAYVKAANADAGDQFGATLAMSADGDYLAVGAPGEDSSASGINQNASDNSATQSGAVYIYARSGTGWSQQGYVKASNTDSQDHYGWAVAISGDSDTLAVGAKDEDSSSKGINTEQVNNAAADAGAVYIY